MVQEQPRLRLHALSKAGGGDAKGVFLTFQSELNPETLGCELQGAWCTILHEQFEKEDPDLLYYLFMVWGQDNLPAVYAEWEDGEAEQVAEDAYSELVTGSTML